MKKLNNLSKGLLAVLALSSASAFAFFDRATIFTYYATSAKVSVIGEKVNGCLRNGGHLDGQSSPYYTISYGDHCSTIDIPGDEYYDWD